MKNTLGRVEEYGFKVFKAATLHVFLGQFDFGAVASDPTDDVEGDNGDDEEDQIHREEQKEGYC